MLILKGNFLKGKASAGRCAAVLALAAALAATLAAVHAAPVPAAPKPQAAAPQPARAPEAVAAEFYGWYLEALSADQDPLSDRHERFTRYVARELTRQLILRMQQPPLPDTDYFLQARSWQPGWQQGIRASLLRREQRGEQKGEQVSAEVLVTLGGGGGGGGSDGPARVLVLTMQLENGVWKIRRVAPAARGALESSAEQPVI